MRTLPAAMLLTALTIACTTAPPGSPAEGESRSHVLDATQAADTVHVALGESVRVHPADLILRFVEVVSDSRCPATVQCVWAGSVRVRLLVALAAGGATEVVLETSEATGVTRSTTAGGYRITLLPEVAPPAGEPGRYRIALEIRRL